VGLEIWRYSMTGARNPLHLFRYVPLGARRIAFVGLGLVLLAFPPTASGQSDPEGLTPIFSDGFESGDYFSWSRAKTGSPDATVPDLEITEPVATVLFNQNTTLVTVLFADAESGIVLESLRIFADSFRLDPDCVVSTNSAECETPFLGAGSHELTASVWDQAGNRAQVQHAFAIVIDTQPPLIAISSPADGGFVGTPSVEVGGTVSDTDLVASVEVNGTAAVLAGDAFSATVALSEGENLIRVDAADRAGNAGATTILIELDTVARACGRSLEQRNDDSFRGKRPGPSQRSEPDDCRCPGCPPGGGVRGAGPIGGRSQLYPGGSDRRGREYHH